jgi:hypothetical protein
MGTDVPFMVTFASGSVQYRYSSSSSVLAEMPPAVLVSAGEVLVVPFFGTAGANGTTSTHSISSTVLPLPLLASVLGSTRPSRTPPRVKLALAVAAEYGVDELARAIEKIGYGTSLVGSEKRCSRTGG